jgi:hypothetical protein
MALSKVCAVMPFAVASPRSDFTHDLKSAAHALVVPATSSAAHVRRYG